MQGRARSAEPPRILVVEDEFLVALLIEEELHSAGYEVFGPFTSLSSATRASRRERFDVALLDVNLHGQMVYPLADELVERRIPFIFLSGYDAQNTPEKLRRVPRVAKPFDPPVLLSEMSRLVRQVDR